jgi:hypothetical protein
VEITKLPIDGAEWMADVLQKYTLFENDAPKPSHIMQIYTTFAKI